MTRPEQVTRPTALETEPASASRYARWLAGSAVVLAGIGLASSLSQWPKRGLLTLNQGSIEAGAASEAAPPIYGYFRPGFDELGAIALVLAVIGALLAWRVARADRVRAGVIVTGALVFMLAFASAVAVSQGQGAGCVPRGTPGRPVGGCPEPTNGLEGRARDRDGRRVAGGSMRAFVSGFEERLPSLNLHNRSHPPGRLVVEGLARRASAPRLIPVVGLFALWSAAIVVPLWFLARRITDDERASRFAVLLFVVAPAPVMLTVVSHDMRDASLYVTALALLAYGGAYKPGRLPLAAAGGALLGLTAFVNYGIAFPAATAGIWAFATRPWRDAVRVLAVAGLGGLAALVALRAAFGYDLFSAYAASMDFMRTVCPDDTFVNGRCLNGHRPQLYWLAGAPAAWLSMAGIPIAGLALREALLRRPMFLAGVVGPLALIAVLPPTLTGLIPGEIERTMVWAYPFAAIAAGVALVRWEQASGRRRPGLVGILVLLAALQAIVIESLYATLW